MISLAHRSLAILSEDCASKENGTVRDTKIKETKNGCLERPFFEMPPRNKGLIHFFHIIGERINIDFKSYSFDIKF